MKSFGPHGEDAIRHCVELPRCRACCDYLFFSRGPLRFNKLWENLEDKEQKLSTPLKVKVYTAYVGGEEIGKYGSESEGRTALEQAAFERRTWDKLVGNTQEVEFPVGKLIEEEFTFDSVDPRPGKDALGRPIAYQAVQVESQSRPSISYTVGINKNGQAISCTCEGFRYSAVLDDNTVDGHFCKHLAEGEAEARLQRMHDRFANNLSAMGVI